MNDVLERIRKAETMPLGADGKVALWETLQDAMDEIKRLRGLLGAVTLSAATEDKPVPVVRVPKLLQKHHAISEYGKGYNVAAQSYRELMDAAGVWWEEEN